MQLNFLPWSLTRPQLETSSAVNSKFLRKTPSYNVILVPVILVAAKLTWEFRSKLLKSATEDWPFAPAEVVPAIPVARVVPAVPGGLHPPPDHFLQLKDLASALAKRE